MSCAGLLLSDYAGVLDAEVRSRDDGSHKELASSPRGRNGRARRRGASRSSSVTVFRRRDSVVVRDCDARAEVGRRCPRSRRFRRMRDSAAVVRVRAATATRAAMTHARMDGLRRRDAAGVDAPDTTGARRARRDHRHQPRAARHDGLRRRLRDLADARQQQQRHYQQQRRYQRL